jgi:UDP-N-acetylmuramate dehydrogenase
MTVAMTQSRHLIERLPPVRGRLTADAPLHQITWFRVGGPAEVLFKPEDEEDLAAFLAACPEDVPVTVIGVASNLLIRDGGIPGVVIRLGRDFAQTRALEGERLEAGAMTPDLNVARAARDAGLAGLEFLSGIPGTVGGGLRMNAGAYGTEFKDVLVHASILDRRGNKLHATAAEMGMAYRHSDAPKDWIFARAVFQARTGDPAAIAARMAEIQAAREASQPIRSRTGGSTFANPPGGKAWAVIDQAGCRGLTIGGAQVSEKHCNFLINTGDATAADIETLGEEVRRRVRETSGIELRWEIIRIGRPAPAANGPTHG